MKRIFQSIILLITFISILFSCSKNDPVNEWDTNYVSLLPFDYLKPIPSFTLKHAEGEGISGDVNFQFRAITQKKASQDIIINYSVICDGIDMKKINLSSENLIIKAGSTVSEPITLSITDWKYLENIKGASHYTLRIKIKDIKSTASKITKAVYHQEIVLNIYKKAERKKENLLLTNIKDWKFTFMDKVENASSNSVAGTGNRDVATNGIPFWLTVDFKEIKTVTGIKTYHWASSYAPSKVEIFASEDGESWSSVGQWDTKGKIQIITFKKWVKTRYIKYQMRAVPNRVDIKRFYVFAWE